MRILVTGSREWTDVNTIHAALSEFYVPPRRVTLVHGDARGADFICANFGSWAGWILEPHPADYALYGPKRAPWVRNTHMVRLGADVCFAFVLNHSSGSMGTAAMAQQAGIETRIYHVQDF